MRALLCTAVGLFSLVPLAQARAELPLVSAPPETYAGICDLGAPPEVQEHPAPIDCAESKDTGYMSGNPFEITVVHIDNKPVEKSTANAYWVMREAAAAAGVDMHINSGFRTMAEQEYLYNCYINCNCNNCNLAAKPGYSNHQSGHALDLNTSQGGVYNWLAANGGAYGFTETVQGEPWHWEWWGGGPGGGICDITIPPTGYLDGADCTSIRGWAQDPDEPDTGIQVHVYFNGQAGDPNAVGVPLVASEHRDDLCQAIGSCAHGFTLGIPLSLRDNAPHAVHAYGIDTGGGNNPQLMSSPGSFTCAPPALPGVRRHISNPDVLAAWKFDLFWELVTVDDPTLLGIPEWVAIQPAPAMVQADDGTPEVWLLDGPVRRHVPDPAAAKAWHLDLATVVVTPAAQVYAIPQGTPLWPSPILVKGPGPAVYQLDDLQCYPGSPDPQCQEDPGTTGETSGDPTNGDASATNATSVTNGEGSAGTSGAEAGEADTSGAPTSGAPTSGADESGGSQGPDGLPGGFGEDSEHGCGCRTDAPASGAFGLALLLLVRRRRGR